MADKIPKNLTDQIYYDNLEELGFIKSCSCDEKENANYSSLDTLPENVFVDTNDPNCVKFRKYSEPELPYEKIQLLLNAENAINIIRIRDYSKKIKNYALFFVILTVIGLSIAFLFWLSDYLFALFYC